MSTCRIVHALWLGLCLIATVDAKPQKIYSLDLPAQSIADALNGLSEQTGMPVVFSYDLVRDKSSQPVIGRYTIAEALAMLLKNTGLSGGFSNKGVLTISPAKSRTDKPGETRVTQTQSTQRTGIAAFFASIAAAFTVSAQDAALEPQQIEEVTVTARRREENAQSIPIAVTAFSQEDLQRNNINSIGDLQNFVPSLNAQGFGRNLMYLTLRGQGVNNKTGNPAVVTYLNEVPIPLDAWGQSVAGPGMYFDLDNIQVLKGPQGTLFGRNTVGGAILFQSKRPTNELGGYLRATYGNYDDRELDAALNVPMVQDKLLVRFAVNAQEREGYTRSLGSPDHPNGRDLDNSKYFAGRASVTFRPTDRLQNDLIFNRYRYTSHGASEILTHLNPNHPFLVANGYAQSFAEQFALQRSLGIRTQVPTGVTGANNDTLASIADILRVDLTKNLTFRNILGYMKLARLGADDRDGTTVPIIDFTAINGHVQQLTEEAQIQGRSFNDALTWVAGAFFMDSPAQDYDVLYDSGAPVSGSRQSVRSKAGYSQGTYDLSSWLEGLKLTAGVRYTWDEKFSQQRSGACLGLAPEAQDQCTTTIPSSSEALTWNLSLDYQVTPGALVYLAARRGYRPGGINATGTNDISASGNRPYGSEYVTDQEIGLKWDWTLASMPVRTNVAVYHQVYTDAQVTQLIFTGDVNEPFIGVTSNAADARTWGAEFEGSINPTAALRLGASFSWLDYKFTTFKPGVDSASLIATERFGRPPYQYGLNARYTLPMDSRFGDAAVSAHWSWQDSSGYPDSFRGVGGQIPRYDLLTLGASWNRIGGRPIDVSFFMTNALNKTYIVNALAIYNGLGYSLASYGEPRMYGLRLRYNFGD